MLGIFSGGSEDKEPTSNAGDLGLIPGQEDPLEKRMAPHPSILAWRISWTEKPGGLQSMGSPRVRDTTERVTLSLFTKCSVLLQECVSSSFYLIIRAVPLATWHSHFTDKENKFQKAIKPDLEPKPYPASPGLCLHMRTKMFHLTRQ